jgi:hypothetical protein
MFYSGTLGFHVSASTNHDKGCIKCFLTKIDFQLSKSETVSTMFAGATSGIALEQKATQKYVQRCDQKETKRAHSPARRMQRIFESV